MNKYLYIKNSNDWVWSINYINDVYNSNYNRSIKYLSPNELWENIKLVDKIHDKDYNYNDKYYEVGDYVRLLNKKNMFDKENQTYSKNIYMIIEKNKNKYKLQDFNNKELKRYYNYHELQKSEINNIIDKKDNIIIHKKKNKTNRILKNDGIDKNNIINEKLRK